MQYQGSWPDFSNARVVSRVFRYGFSKEFKGTARLFAVGVVQSADWIPLMHTVAPGNANEVATLWLMVERALIGGEGVLGLPAIGFVATSYRNVQARPGQLGIYSSALPHHFTVECRQTDDAPCQWL